jgi:hypothetical protein
MLSFLTNDREVSPHFYYNLYRRVEMKQTEKRSKEVREREEIALSNATREWKLFTFFDPAKCFTSVSLCTRPKMTPSN